MIKVSVVVPAYNAEKYLKECLDSILNQSVMPEEIIIVDDHSTDHTRHIALAFKDKCWKDGYCPHVKYARNHSNKGIGYSRQRGLELAKGKYVCYLSADDVYAEDYVEAMLAAADGEDVMCYSNYYTMDENGSIMYPFHAPMFSSYEEFVIACVNAARSNTMFVCWNIFGSRKIQLKVGYDTYLRFGEDLDFLLRSILIHRVKYVHVNKYLFYYRIHQGNITTSKMREIATNNRRIFEKINKLLGKEVL